MGDPKKPARNERGHWLPGQTGNVGGRVKGLGDFRLRCREEAEKRLPQLLAVLDGKKTRDTDRIRAWELLAAYGFGKPASMPDENEKTMTPESILLLLQAAHSRIASLEEELKASRGG